MREVDVVDVHQLRDEDGERPVLQRGALRLEPGGLVEVAVGIEQRE